MKIITQAVIDIDNLTMTREEMKELILELDLKRGEVDFTLDICKSLVKSMIKNGECSKEEILKSIFE